MACCVLVFWSGGAGFVRATPVLAVSIRGHNLLERLESKRNQKLQQVQRQEQEGARQDKRPFAHGDSCPSSYQPKPGN